MLLRAAIAVEGCSVPIYEAVYTLRQYNSPRIHMLFLKELKSLLPESCSPIVITDAGFRGPWFKAVEALGWHWVGRIRNSIKYRLLSRKCWRYTTDLYYRANKKSTYLGPAELSHKRSYLCHLLKSDKYGFGITVSRSKNIERLNLLLLIGALATLCLWWVGCHARHLRWHRHFQANTVSNRNVLSVLFLAAAVLRRPDYKINDTELIESWRSFHDSWIQLISA